MIMSLATMTAGEPASPPPYRAGPERPPLAERLAKQRRLALELGPLWIAVGNFIRPKLGVTTWARGSFAGELLLAPAFRYPQRIAGVGTIAEVGGELGYRQYFWRGLNLEFSALLLRSQVDSSIDGLRYVGFNIFLTGTAGWRVDFWLRRTTFYLLPQVGVGGDVLRTRPPAGSDHPPPRLVGDLLLGFRF
jgi:hypothetical protein